jgi:thiosulfate/3-mercaptopyruvate sulfurtransferase
MTSRTTRFHVNNLIFVAGLIIFLIMSGACQQKPTRIHDVPPEAWARLTEKTKKPLKLNDETVVLDARNDFEYGLAHWSASTHLQWTSLLADERNPSVLVTPQVASQRLALIGIEPQTPVLVIGQGIKGNAEEGRLAWTLLYFGVQDVQTVSVDGLDVYFTHQDTPPRRNASVWESRPRERMRLDRSAFIKAAFSPRKTATGSVYIIDVRSQKEYFNRSAAQSDAPDVRALNIEWKEFFGSDGRPSKIIKDKLKKIGIQSEDEIIVISNHGNRSSAASYALMALGFTQVRNFIDGWDSLVKKTLK